MTIEFVAVVVVPIAVLAMALIIQLVALCKRTHLSHNVLGALTLLWIGVPLISSQVLFALGWGGVFVVIAVLMAANFALLGWSETRRNRSKH